MGGHESKGLLSMTRIDWTTKRKATVAAHTVMNVLQDLDISLGHFLSTILAPDADLQPSAREKVRRFISGTTAHGLPLDIVKSIVNHPHATSYRAQRPVETPFPIPDYASPPAQSSVSPDPSHAEHPPPSQAARPPTANILRAFFVDETLNQIRCEVQSLSKLEVFRSDDGDAGYSWTRVLAFHFSSVMAHVLESAPVLWSVITTAAIGDAKRSVQIRETMRSSENKSGRGSNNARDPWLVSISADVS